VTKTISKFSDSEGVIFFDAALMKLARLEVGDQMDITVIPESGAIVLKPIRKRPSKKETSSLIKKTAKNYRKTLHKLS
jgi:hypothetical protein